MSVIPGWRLSSARSKPRTRMRSTLARICSETPVSQGSIAVGRIGKRREHRTGRRAVDGELRPDPHAEREIRRALDLGEYENPTGRVGDHGLAESARSPGKKFEDVERLIERRNRVIRS